MKLFKTDRLTFTTSFSQGDVTGMFLTEDLQQLAEDVDYFSLMTYDYSSPARPGPNSPVQWVRRFVPLYTTRQQGEIGSSSAIDKKMTKYFGLGYARV